MRVRDLMSKRLLTLRENASVGRADAEMRLAQIRHFPVVDRRRNLVGVLSHLDVARALGRKPRSYGRAVAVADVMSRKVLTVALDAPAEEAARKMRRHRVSSLPVVDEAGGLVGMITATDFLRVAEGALASAPRWGSTRRRSADVAPGA